MAAPNDRTSATRAADPRRGRRPGQADGQGEAPERRTFDGERRDGWGLDPNLGRGEAGLGSVEGDLGAGTPPNVDVHKLGQDDRPEQDWGEPGDAEATFSSNHSRRGGATIGQGGKTRRANKDIVSRRGS